MNVVSKAKEKPLMVIAVTIITLVAGFVGAWEGIGLIDKLHTTETELLLYDLKAHTFASGQFDDLQERLTETDIISKCRWLKSEVRALEDAIYVRRRDGADADYIHALENDLDDLNDDYAALGCAKKLA